MKKKLKETLEAIRVRYPGQPVVGLILGSGLGAFADLLCERTAFPFTLLPHFPGSTVSGHPGKLVFGTLEQVPVVLLQGRIHLYEGYPAAETAYPARVLCGLGIRALIVTNAAGGINPAFTAGDLMLITDHINLMGANPLTGPNDDELGPRFPDMSEAYDARLRVLALEAARQLEIDLRQGVYLGLAGPSYETPAEIRMCRTLGADAVGMSTIPEVIVANHMGVPVLGISCIANLAAGMLPGRLSHQEVLETTASSGEKISRLLRAIIARIGG